MHRSTWLGRKALCAFAMGCALGAPVPGLYAQSPAGAEVADDKPRNSQRDSGDEQRDFRQDGRDGRQGYWRDKPEERSELWQDPGESRRGLREVARNRAETGDGGQDTRGDATRHDRRESSDEVQRRDQFAQQLREAELAGDEVSAARWRRALAASNAELDRRQRELHRYYVAERDRPGAEQQHPDPDSHPDRDARLQARDGENRADRSEGGTRVSLWKDKQP